MSLYVPSHFMPRERSAAMRLVHDHPFATLITPRSNEHGHGEPVITHLPLVHVADCEPHGTLLGHFARANLHSAHAEAAESIAVFVGPHAYVSPSLYEDPAVSVPTWNYAVVHAHGTLHLATDAVETRAILDAMISRFEAPRAQPWKLGMDAPRLEAKFKLSQNRSPEDQRNVAAELATGDAASAAPAAWMREYADEG